MSTCDRLMPWLWHDVSCTGTVNIQLDLLAGVFVESLSALRPLSLEGAEETMVQWGGTQTDEKMFNHFFFFGGVPRLLEFVFQTDGELASTFATAFNAMSKCFQSSYGSAAPFFDQPDAALLLVVCSAARWNATDRELVSGTATLAVVRHFQRRSRISRWRFYVDSEQLAEKARELNISAGLLPPDDLLPQQGPHSRGTHCGKSMFAMLWPPVSMRHLVCLQQIWFHVAVSDNPTPSDGPCFCSTAQHWTHRTLRLWFHSQKSRIVLVYLHVWKMQRRGLTSRILASKASVW